MAAGALTSIETYRLIEPEAAFFGGPRPASLIESITEGFGVEETYQFIRAGQDPNEPMPIDHPDYTGGAAIRVSPLMLAVAAEDASAVQMLLSFGARLDLPQNARVECLAREIGNPEILALISEGRGESAGPACADRQADAPTPLVAWAD